MQLLILHEKEEQTRIIKYTNILSKVVVNNFYIPE